MLTRLSLCVKKKKRATHDVKVKYVSFHLLSLDEEGAMEKERTVTK